MTLYGSLMKRRSSSLARYQRALALAYLGTENASEVHLKRIIEQHIERVLAASDYNRGTAAELLGVHRRSIERYLRSRRAPKRGR
jgi:ActR/RegA family two-component response regulator